MTTYLMLSTFSLHPLCILYDFSSSCALRVEKLKIHSTWIQNYAHINKNQYKLQSSSDELKASQSQIDEKEAKIKDLNQQLQTLQTESDKKNESQGNQIKQLESQLNVKTEELKQEKENQDKLNNQLNEASKSSDESGKLRMDLEENA